MKLEDLLGDAYKDDITVDEIREFLKDKTFVDPATLPKSVAKETFDKVASELSATKKKLRELEEKNMSEEEKLAKEIEKVRERETQYLRELAKLRAKEIFVGAGLTESEYEALLDMVVSEDEETTKAKAKTVIDLIVSQKTAVEKAVKAELLKDVPKPPAGEGSKGITKEDFEKMSWIERTELKRTKPELYQQLVNN